MILMLNFNIVNCFRRADPRARPLPSSPNLRTPPSFQEARLPSGTCQTDTPQHQRLIALSGFGTEILFAPLLYLAGLWLYPWVVAVHLMAYPFYAGMSRFPSGLTGFAGDI